MTNGYKPSPIDLSHVRFTEKMEELVEELATNAHNVWASERIKQGWTYGYKLDQKNKRNFRLVPFALLDEAAKESNRNSTRELLRTLMGYGYAIEAPDERSQSTLKGKDSALEGDKRFRTFRIESTYALTEGKWYYEFVVQTDGEMRVGWAVPTVDADKQIGIDNKSFTFDGSSATKWHNGPEAYGKRWKTNDVIGCLLDFDEQCISFSVNGEPMIDNQGQELAFSEIGTEGLVPVAYFAEGQRAQLNLGIDPNSFKFYKMYGLQEGYAPFCQNISYPLPIWYTKSLPSFTPITQTDSTRVVRIQV